MHEYVGNMHMHTPYSDGTKWHADIAADAIAAGLDFIIVTDHNIWVDGLEGYVQTDRGRVLLLVGEEVHDVRRRPQANHFLAFGAARELAPFAADPQVLIEKTIDAGGLGFLAHPYDRALPLANEQGYGWVDWDINGFTGIEIWNYMSSFKNELSRRLERLPLQSYRLGQLVALRLARQPDRHIVAPEPEVLARWDQLLAAGRRVVAVGNSDAHGTTFRLGPYRQVIYPYEACFTAVNTHVLTTEPLQGELARDRALILEALRAGRAWVAYDRAGSTRGFRFTGQGVNKGVIGDEVRLDVGATLQIRSPAAASIRIIRHGETVVEVESETNLTYIPVEPGAYRVECSRFFKGRKRGWIYSNPIYLV